MATASPSNKNSTHHIVLTQNGSSVGLNFCDRQGNVVRDGYRKHLISGASLQIHEGEAGHSDLELPWKTIQQVDWSGGLGRKYFDDDSTAYEYGDGFDTTKPGMLIAAGDMQFPTGHRAYYKNWPVGTYDRTAFPLNDTNKKLSISFTSTGTEKLDRLIVYLRKVGTPTGAITLALYSDNGSGSPDAVLASKTYSTGSLNRYFYPVVLLSYNYTLTNATVYHVVIDYSSGTATDYIDVLCASMPGVGKKYITGWSNADAGMFFRFYGVWFPSEYYPFIYKNSLYTIKAANNLSVSTKLYINGDCGAATSGSTTTLVDTAKTGGTAWVTDEWAGCVVVFNRGAGSNQDENFAIITSNTGDTLTFPAVQVAPAAQTEYSILGSNKFTEITGHGLAQKFVTDILVANGAIYVCQGGDANVRLMRFYVNTGTGAWTPEYADEGYKAQFLKPYSNATAAYIAAALPGVPAQVKSAAPVDHSANASSTTALGITAATAETVGDLYEKITGLEVYQYGRLHALKEHSIHAKDENGDWYQIDIREMEETPDGRNGRAHLVNGLYLWFSWLNGVERYSFAGSVIDGMGHDKTELGLERYGGRRYKHLTQYPGKVIACVETSYWSRLMMHNLSGRDGVGWCNMHSSISWVSSYNERFNRSLVQSIPGVSVDRLWISKGGDIVWIPITNDAWGATYAVQTNEVGYLYAPLAQLETATFTAKFHDVDKLWESITLEVDHALRGTASFGFEYMVEYDIFDNNGWQLLGTKVTTTGATTLTLSTTHSVVSKKIKFRISLFNMDYNYSPIITAIRIKSLLRVPIKWVATAYVRIADSDTDLLGKKDPQDADAKLALLDTFMSTPEPIYMTSIWRRLNAKYWVLDPSEFVPVKNEPVGNNTGESNTETHVYSIRFIEVA